MWNSFVTSGYNTSSVPIKKGGRITVSKERIKNLDLWKHIKKIEIQYTTDKKFKRNVKTKVISKNDGKITGKNLQKGKTYYVRARYTTEDDVKTKWSNIKKFKMRK